MRKDQRSLFLRFFGTFAAAALALWLGVLAYETATIRKGDAQGSVIETRSQALLILNALRTSAGDPAGTRATLEQLARLHQDVYLRGGFPCPSWRLEVWRDGAPLYAAEHAMKGGPAPGAPVPPGWNQAVEHDPATGLTVRLTVEIMTVWSFALAGAPHDFIPLLYSIPLLLAPAWFIIRRGLAPVRQIVDAIGRRSATELAPLSVSPYRELAPLVDSVNQLMARLSAHLARERQFLSNAAHHLRTPLAAIQASANLVGSLPPDAPPGAAARSARAGLCAGVRDAAHITHQLLALARSDRDLGAQAHGPCDLAELLRSRLALAVARARTHGVELVLEAPDSCRLLLHREGMVALIDNLVDNAVKYSPGGACVDIVLECAACAGTPDQALVRLSVRDHGPGIPARLRPQVFERFFRVPGQDRPGSGLGLAIVAQVAYKHGARVHLSDNPHAAGAGPGLCAVVEWRALSA